MRRLTLAAIAATLFLAACSDQGRETPTEPSQTAPDVLSSSCGPVSFPFGPATALIAKVFPPGNLRVEGVARAKSIATLWNSCQRESAQKAAISFIEWMSGNSARLIGTQQQRNDLINLILNGVGIPGSVPPTAPADFGIGFFDPNSDQPLQVITLSKVAMTEVPAHAFSNPMIIKVARKIDDEDLTDTGGLNQFPPAWDYDAIRSSGITSNADHVLQNGSQAAIVFCLLNSDFVDPPYPANRGIGHNPVPGAPGFPFEILEPIDLDNDRPDLAAQLDCPNLARNTAAGLGALGSGLPGLANAVLRTAGHSLNAVAQAMFLPQPLQAATMGTLPPPIGGRAPSLTPFKVVEVSDEFGFENGEQEWSPTGFWNRNGFIELTNQAFPQFVSTFVQSEGEDQAGGDFPNPIAGSFSAWYGQASKGNYIGTQATPDAEGSGGTSTGPNSGSLVSPFFKVPDQDNVQLTFKTWWEIESVNPAEFDLMQVQVQKATGDPQPLLQLNPTGDPTNPADRRALPYTSGGFNTAPIWQDVTIPLSDYRGQTVRIRLVFNTGDERYNGFRGWIVDQVAVVVGEGGPFLQARKQMQLRTGLVPADQVKFPSRGP
jgi:immune inhibitor InhA-like protein